MKKTYICFIICVILVIALALPAFAGSAEENSGNFSITAECTMNGSSHGVYGPAGSYPVATASVMYYDYIYDATKSQAVSGSSYSTYWLASFSAPGYSYMYQASTNYNGVVAVAFAS